MATIRQISFLTKICEIMAKLVSHASRLKGDDIRLKGLPLSHKACSNCDMFVKEDLFHIVMQCPAQEITRRELYKVLHQQDNSLERIFLGSPREVFSWFIGKTMEDKDITEMFNIWTISGRFITDMYYYACLNRD